MVEQLICFGYIHEKTADKATELYRLFFFMDGWKIISAMFQTNRFVLRQIRN